MVIKIKPDFALAYNNLGNVLIGEGKIKQGINYYKEALRIRPDLAVAQRNLEAVLAKSSSLNF